MTNPLQKYEWMLRIPITNMQTGQELIRRLPDPDPADESSLLSAVAAMDDAIWNLRQWAEKHGVEIKQAMHT